MLSKKEYENIIIKNDKFTEDTLIALGLVKKYVVKHKLLIVGGMAIDFALRLKGEKLYEDDVLPDYDFYSPNYNTDAYHIAEKLKKAGLENVSVINANHISTMRVRVNYTVVADVTYIPKLIYDNLPFIVYRDIRIIHPHYQMIDQHRALSYPYENPPWEVITHRWKKDATRYDLLYEYYPLKNKIFESSNKLIDGGGKLNNKFKTLITEYSKDYKYQKDYIKYLCEDINKEFEPIETFDDIPRQLPYQNGAKLIKPQVHIGQRKLFLTELQFLTKMSAEFEKKIIYCIYAGAAPSNKTHYLSQLFPHIKFILIDPNKFDIKLPNLKSHRSEPHNDIIHLYYDYPTQSNIYKKGENDNKKESDMSDNERKKYLDFIKSTNYKIYIIEDYMTDNYSELFKELDHFFISDIRSNMSDDGHPTEFDIYWNSSMMFNWISILQPEYSMLKFRPLYSGEKNILEYKEMDSFKVSLKYGINFKSDIKKKIYQMPKSTLYLQTWAGKTSSELRMWIKKSDLSNIVKYDCTKIENQLFYFNNINRGLCYHKNSNYDESLHFCYCNDCALENKIWDEYIALPNNQYISIKDLIIKLGIITYRPLNKSHNTPLFDKLNYDTFINYIKSNEIERKERIIRLTGKKYVKHKGDAGVDVGGDAVGGDAVGWDAEFVESSATGGVTDVSTISLKNEITISSIVFKDQCLSGFAGLLYWELHAKKLGYKNRNISLGKIQEDSGGYIIQIPIDSHGISVYSDNVIQLHDELVKKYDIKEERQYNRFLDKLPHKFILNNEYELFDNKGYMLSAHKTINNIYMANLQNIMLYMLTNLILFGINSNKAGLQTNRGYSFYIGYLTAQSIVKWAGDEYKKSPVKKYMPFLPSAEIYGTTEVSDSYINSKRQFLEKIHEREKEKLQPDVIFPETFVGGKIPEKYYKFRPDKSPILQFDGAETKKYNNRIYI